MAEHGDEPDVASLCSRLAEQLKQHASPLARFSETYLISGLAMATNAEVPSLGFVRPGTLGLLLDLIDLYVLANEVDITWTLVAQTAQGLRDESLLNVVKLCQGETLIQVQWLRTRLKQAAPQVLVAAES